MTTTLTEALLPVLCDALADGAAFRDPAAMLDCADCAWTGSDPVLCPDHRADYQRAVRYRQALHQLKAGAA